MSSRIHLKSFRHNHEISLCQGPFITNLALVLKLFTSFSPSRWFVFHIYENMQTCLYFSFCEKASTYIANQGLPGGYAWKQQSKLNIDPCVFILDVYLHGYVLYLRRWYEGKFHQICKLGKACFIQGMNFIPLALNWVLSSSEVLWKPSRGAIL